MTYDRLLRPAASLAHLVVYDIEFKASLKEHPRGVGARRFGANVKRVRNERKMT